MTATVPAVWSEQVGAVLPDALALYTDLHRHPELAFQEHRTTARLVREIESAGFRVTPAPGTTGLVASLDNGPGPVVALRADIDGLPVRETTGVGYASTATGLDTEGRPVPTMHACGHDVHATALVAAARVLAGARERWRGTVVLIAQPAEEVGSGARTLLDSGVFDGHPRPDVVLGQHVGVGIPAGVVRSHPGTFMAAQRNWRIRLRGRGGHAAAPHATVGVTGPAARIVLQLESLVASELDSADRAVLTVTTVHGGTASNVLPDEIVLTAGARAFDRDVLDALEAAVRRVVAGQAAAAGLTDEPEITTFNDFPANSNDPATLDTVRSALAAELGPDALEEGRPMLGSEDFGEIPTTFGVPSAYWHFGGGLAPEVAGDDPAPAGHSSRFAPDPERALGVGARALVAAAVAFLPVEG